MRRQGVAGALQHATRGVHACRLGTTGLVRGGEGGAASFKNRKQRLQALLCYHGPSCPYGSPLKCKAITLLIQGLPHGSAGCSFSAAV